MSYELNCKKPDFQWDHSNDTIFKVLFTLSVTAIDPFFPTTPNRGLTSMRQKLRAETVESASDVANNRFLQSRLRYLLGEVWKNRFFAADGVLSAERSVLCRRLLTD